ncbi:MAG: hypothetical protein E7256_17795 [Lachnospiraceae bacterium]|nr:hypothetical protein [Lachnospiraceae bacterium]
MNILYVNWNCLGAEDAYEALQELGHTLFISQLSDKSHVDTDFHYVEVLRSLIKKHNIELVFSFNYFPTISVACKDSGCQYMAWIYDNPAIKVYSPTVLNECNYIFSFDSAMVEELKTKGVPHVFYSPMAVNTKRLSALTLTPKQKQMYECDIAFVGSLYNEKHNFYDRLAEKSGSPYLIGYLDGLMEAQLKVYGYNFLSEAMADDIVDAIYQAMPFKLEEGSLASLADVYADYFLCRRMAYLERSQSLALLAQNHKVHCYTNNPDARIGNAINIGSVNYFMEMPLAFKGAKVNLNMTLRSIKNGIPLRAMDIMGSGGFLLSNYQADFLKHFEIGKEMVCYGSVEEMMEMAEFYVRNDEARAQIAQNGYKKVSEQYTYSAVLKNMLAHITCY